MCKEHVLVTWVCKERKIMKVSGVSQSYVDERYLTKEVVLHKRRFFPLGGVAIFEKNTLEFTT
jgi:hypothetical protein